jgi:hypothetical protein
VKPHKSLPLELSVAKKELSAQLNRLGANGKSLAMKASLLSDAIATICDTLISMNGKLELAVCNSDLSVGLERQSAGWAVTVHYPDEGLECVQDLTAAPIRIKAIAFPMLISLLDELEEKQQEQITQIENALDAYGGANQIQKLLGNREQKEGN